MDKTNIKRIIMLSQYSSLYNINDSIKSKILNAHGNSLTLIYNKHIKNQKINSYKFFKALIQSKSFRNLSDKDKIFLLNTQIDKYIKSYYHNSIKSVKFQELLNSILQICKESVNQNIRNVVSDSINQKYGYKPSISFIAQKKRILFTNENQIIQIKELFDWISEIQSINQISKSAEIRMRISKSNQMIKTLNSFDLFLTQNSYAKQIFKELGNNALEIQNTYRFNQIDKILSQTYQKMRKLNDGSKKSVKSAYFDISEEQDLDHHVSDSNINIIFTTSKKIKALKNKMFKNNQITILDSFKNNKRRSNKETIVYKYEIEINQLKTLKHLSDKTLEYLDNIKLTETSASDKEFHEIRYKFNYEDQHDKYVMFKRYCRYLGAYIPKEYEIFYPVKPNIKLLQNSFAHRAWELNPINDLPKNYGNLTKITNLQKINKNIYHVLIEYDLKAIEWFYDGINQINPKYARMNNKDIWIDKMGKIGRLVKDLSIDLVNINQKSKLVKYMREHVESDKTYFQKAISMYQKYNYISSRLFGFNNAFYEDLKKFYLTEIYRNIAVSRSIKELNNYGLRLSKLIDFPILDLKWEVKRKIEKSIKPKDKFAELLDDHEKTVKYVKTNKKTQINSLHLLKAIWEISQRVDSMQELNLMIYALIMHKMDAEIKILNNQF